MIGSGRKVSGYSDNGNPATREDEVKNLGWARRTVGLLSLLWVGACSLEFGQDQHQGQGGDGGITGPGTSDGITGFSMTPRGTRVEETCPVPPIIFDLKVLGNGQFDSMAVFTASVPVTQIGFNRWRWDGTNVGGQFRFYGSARGDPARKDSLIVTVDCPSAHQQVTYHVTPPNMTLSSTHQSEQGRLVAVVDGNASTSGKATYDTQCVTVSPNTVSSVPDGGILFTVTRINRSTFCETDVWWKPDLNPERGDFVRVFNETDVVAPPPITGITIAVSPGTTVNQCPSTVTYSVTVTDSNGGTNHEATLVVTSGSGALTKTGFNTWTMPASASGQTTVRATAVENTSVSTSTTVTINCPPAQPTITGISIAVSPGSSINQCPTTVTFTVTVQGTGNFNQEATLVVTSGSGTLTKTGFNTWTMPASASGQTTVRATAVGNTSVFTSTTVTISCEPPQNACTSMTIDYAPQGGSIAVGSTRVLSSIKSANWPTGCRVGWYIRNRPDLFKIEGDVDLPVVDGTSFTSGDSADLTAIAAGAAETCAQVFFLRPDGFWDRVTTAGAVRCYMWTATSGSEK